jgi:hypothetical protein
MSINVTLILLALGLATALIAITIAIKRHQRSLLRRRRAQHQLRGAIHIKELALSTQIYTGRNDIALALLPLTLQMLDQALQLTPDDAELGAARRECQQLTTALLDGTNPNGPELATALDSESALNRAQMELMEAIRLLGRVEKLDWVAAPELQEMLDALRQTQRAIGLRLSLRQAAQQAANRAEDDPAVAAIRANPGR